MKRITSIALAVALFFVSIMGSTMLDGLSVSNQALPVAVYAEQTTGPQKVRNLQTVSRTKTSIRLCWQNQTHVTGYQVLMREGSDGTFQKLATVKGEPAFTAAGLKTGAAYQFKVRAFSKQKGQPADFAKSSAVLTVSTLGKGDVQKTLEPTALKPGKAERERMMQAVETALQKKDYGAFSPDARRFIKELAERLFEHYGAWETAFNGMPSLEEYFNTMFLRAINNCNGIHMTDQHSPEGRFRISLGNSTASTRTATSIISLVYNGEENPERIDHDDDLESLLHELTHCKDAFGSSSLVPLDVSWGDLVESIIYEGGATFHQKLMLPVFTNFSGCSAVYNANDTKELSFGLDTASGYARYLNVYQNLVYLAGFSAVESIEQTASLDTLKQALEENYGAETADNIWTRMCKFCKNYIENCFDGDLYQYAVETQKLLLSCIEQDIQKLDVRKPESIRRFMHIYRAYKVKTLVGVLNEEFKEITEKVFHLHRLDDLLAEKIAESGALGTFSSNKKLNKMAIKAILHADRNTFASSEDSFNTFYLPGCIATTRYEYSESGGTGRLRMYYANEKDPDCSVNYEPDVCALIEFNEEEITRIDRLPSTFD